VPTRRSDLQPTRRLKPLLQPPAAVPPWLWRSVSRLTGVDHLEILYRQLPTDLRGAEFAVAALGKLGISWDCHAAEWERVPAAGPLIVVANHPFGGIDGLAAIAGLCARRPDLKVIATTVLAAIPALQDLVIPVDNFGRSEAHGANVRAVRQALRHVWGGGALLIFPAGQVAHLDLATRLVADPPWKRSAITLVRAARATVVPLYVHGSNSVGFQLAGLLHPALRTALRPREVANKRGLRLDLRVGMPLSAERVAACQSAERLGRLLRVRLYSLAAPRGDGTTITAMEHSKDGVPKEAVAETPDPRLLAKEINLLSAAARLVTTGNIEIYLASGTQIDRLLDEIGRLRELTFREVGEGTGRARDLDRFDPINEHLIAWDISKNCVIGGYRLARIDAVRRRYGRAGLYLSTLFEFRDPFFALLGPAVELGRSFVRPEYQRSYAPLLALWRGIGEFVARNPRYSRLIGPVSVSADYDHASRDLMVRYLRWHHFDPVLGALVRARTPYRPYAPLAALGRELRTLQTLDELSPLMGTSRAGDETSARGPGVPVLLRQYLKLGGRILGFNVDPAFAYCVDCLTLVDLCKTPDTVLGKYMSPEGLEGFRRQHAARPSVRS
jgi:putative hemolysin